MRLTATLLQERLNLLDEIKTLTTKISAKRTRISEIEKAASSHMEKNNLESEVKGRHVIKYEEYRSSVSWKSEFVRVAGADAAVKVTAKAPMKSRLVFSTQ